ncbi:hypothetical protein ACFWU3_29430 [Streptomyces sp. NPDC058685]|uniref:hypothetical protein n=1 Tax=Streptomyces sp. NPDC058685 TaxID=3346598 RepID=UPI003663A971
MTSTRMGLLTGLALGFAAAFGGFTAFLLVLTLGAIGLLAGLYLDGHLQRDGSTGRDSADVRGRRDHRVR